MPRMTDQTKYTDSQLDGARRLAQRMLDEMRYTDTAWLPITTVRNLIALAILTTADVDGVLHSKSAKMFIEADSLRQRANTGLVPLESLRREAWRILEEYTRE